MRITKRLRKPAGYRPILSIESDAKTSKSIPLGWLTGIIYLAAADSSGVANVCPMAHYCKKPCLVTSGHGSFGKTQAIRKDKTILLFTNRAMFLESLRYDIKRLINKARKRRLKPVVRINGTSDLPWLALMMAAEFPRVQFYDYTKIPRPESRVTPNYHLTFSHDGNEANVAECLRVLKTGVNVAMVFDTKKGRPLPETWNGFPVLDGDAHDLRFLDSMHGAIIGLRAKGRAKKDTSPFVVRAAAAELIQIGLVA